MTVTTMNKTDTDSNSAIVKSEADDKIFRLYVLMSQVNHAIHRAREEELLGGEVTAEQAAVLMVVACLGERATPAKISQWLLRKRQSITGVLNRMVKQGLVTKNHDLARRNMVRVALTKKGLDAYHQTDRGRAVYDILDALSEDEREQLRFLLRKLRENAFRKIGIEHKAFFDD